MFERPVVIFEIHTALSEAKGVVVVGRILEIRFFAAIREIWKFWRARPEGWP